MNYKNYTIEPDNTGYAPKNMTFVIFKEEEYIGSGETITANGKVLQKAGLKMHFCSTKTKS